MAEHSDAKSAKRSFAQKIQIRVILTRSFASRSQLRFVPPFLAKFKRTTNWSLYPHGLRIIFRTVNLAMSFIETSCASFASSRIISVSHLVLVIDSKITCFTTAIIFLAASLRSTNTSFSSPFQGCELELKIEIQIIK